MIYVVATQKQIERLERDKDFKRIKGYDACLKCGTKLWIPEARITGDCGCHK